MKLIHTVAISFQSQNDEPAKKLVTHVATTVLSSKSLIPCNISDDVTFGIIKRIATLLMNDIIPFSDNALKQIFDNIFPLSTETKRLHVQFQQILELLQSHPAYSNVRTGSVLWFKVAIHIQDNLTANIDAHKELIYDYVQWVIRNSKFCQVS